MRRTALKIIVLRSFAARRFKPSPYQHSPQRWANFAGSSIAIYAHPAQQISLPCRP